MGAAVAPAFAAPPVTVGPDLNARHLTQNVAYRVDANGRLDIADVRAASAQDAFNDNRGRGPLNLGAAAGGTYWLRLELVGAPELQRERFLLALHYAPLDEVVLYPPDAGARRAGDSVALSERPRQTREPVFPVRVPAGAERTFYLRVRTHGLVQLPLTLATPTAHADHVAGVGLALGVYYGVMLALLLYAGLVYLSTRERLYLDYAFAAASTVLVLLCLNGYPSLYLWPEQPGWSNRLLAVAGPLALLGLTRFSRTFLQSRPYGLHLDRAVRLTEALLLVTALAALVLPYGTAVALVALLAGVAAPLVLVAGTRCWRQGVAQAGYFMLAWSACVIAAAISALQALAVLPITAVSQYTLQAGSAAQFLLLAFALAERSLTRRADLARVQREANEQLERRVQERTQEFQNALQQLREANRQLHENARVDDLTGVYNRAHFDACFEAECRRARRDGMALGVVMADCDHFKAINDAHGHPVGDSVLAAVAVTLQSQLNRATDVLARYGGEEFIALLPDADRAGVREVAGRMRTAVANSGLDCDAGRLALTVSVGFYIFHPQGVADECLAAIARADAALYAAKTVGRDQIVDAVELEQAAVPPD